MTNGSFMKVESIAEYSLHLSIIGIENQFLVFLRVIVLHRFYCNTHRISVLPEKFGNRDYLLNIETASMEDDAEYSVLAKIIRPLVNTTA